MGFTCPLRAQLDVVVVVLAEGDQARELDEAGAKIEMGGHQTDTLHEQINPLVTAEGGTGLLVFLHIDIGNLDGLDALDDPGRDAFLLADHEGEGDDTPYAVGQQTGMLFDGHGVHGHLADVEVAESGLIPTVGFVQTHRYLVDDAVAVLLFDPGLDKLGFVTVNEVVLDDAAHGLNACLNDLLIG